MTRLRIASLVFAAALGAGAGVAVAQPHDAGFWTERARALAADSRHDEARAALDSALAHEDGYYPARLLRARIDAWDGRFDEAERRLEILLTERPGEPGARQVRAYLHYYRGHLEQAEREFEALVREYPGDGDARQGLAAVRRAREVPAPHPWRADAGAEYSTFSRRPLDDWNQQFIQLSRRVGDGRTAVHIRADRYRQFGLTDATMEAGASRAFTPGFNAAVAAGAAIAPDFRPAWRVRGDAAWRAWSVTDQASSPSALWLLAEARHDAYEDVGVSGAGAGVRLVREAWEGTLRLNTVASDDNDPLYGWMARLDGPVGPVAGVSGVGLRFWAGLADAPETVSGAGGSVTVSTRTVFTGIRANLAGAWVLNAGYARDDRENSWIRHNLHASIARLF